MSNGRYKLVPVHGSWADLELALQAIKSNEQLHSVISHKEKTVVGVVDGWLIIVEVQVEPIKDFRTL